MINWDHPEWLPDFQRVLPVSITPKAFFLPDHEYRGV